MMRSLLYFLLYIISSFSITVIAQDTLSLKMNPLPDKFIIQASSGGVAPWTEHTLLHIYTNGNADYIRYIPNDMTAPPLKETKFSLTSSHINELWQIIETNNFFSLDSLYVDENVKDGFRYILSVTTENKCHQVTVQNIHQPQFDRIIQTINRLIPKGCDL